jgi:DNA transformation protein
MDSERIKELFAPFGPVAVRRMFGGHRIYVDGFHIALEHDGEIFLKADTMMQARFESAGSRPFVYQTSKKSVTMSYWRLVDSAFENEDELREWALLALAAAQRAQAKMASNTARGTRGRGEKMSFPKID